MKRVGEFLFCHCAERNWKRQKVAVMTWLLILVFHGSYVMAAQEPELYSTAAVLMDGESGRVLYGKNETMALANASTTKIMTCILTLESCDLEEEVTISGYCTTQPKVKMELKKGETYLVRDLLYSLMLESHNDAAVALAEHVGKKYLAELQDKSEKDLTSEESQKAVRAFAALMNQKAEEIGCENTYFITPNGLDATEEIASVDGEAVVREHHVTATDLARILSYCIMTSPKRGTFLAVTRTPEHAFVANGRGFVLHNHNSFLSMMEGALTGKTGFTGKAGYCYVGALVRDKRLYVVALLACGWPSHREYKWKDCRTLMEYGLKNFRRVEFHGDDGLATVLLPEVKVRLGQSDHVGECVRLPVAVAGGEGHLQRSEDEGIEEKKGLEGLLPEGDGILLREDERINRVIELNDMVDAPVALGQKVGEIRYLVGDQIMKTEMIIAAKAVKRIDFSWCLRQTIQKYLHFGRIKEWLRN